jgi:lipid A 4'-phosphatase
MSYLKLRHAQLILACFLISSLVFVKFPGIDLSISTLFFDKGFHLAGQWKSWIQDSVRYFLCLSVFSVVGFYIYNRRSKRNLCGIDRKKVIYLLLVLVLGAGMIVNGVFKEDFGRARPRDIVEFGGSKVFTPAFVVSHECDTNCSFSSGDGAGAFFAMALALALSRKRLVFLAAFAYGAVVSYSRIASGAHFLSDCVVSFFVMLIIADVLYYYMVLTERERVPGAGLASLYVGS